jgi:isochorismate synthase
MSEAPTTGLLQDDAADTAAAPLDAPQFLLRAPRRSLAAQGCRARLPAGTTATLAERVARFFASARPGPAVLVGALPFDPDADDALFQPDTLTDTLPAAPGVAPATVADLRAEPSPAAYVQAVADAVTVLRSPGATLHKVVLARSLRVASLQPVAPTALAARLGQDPNVATYVVPLPDAGAEPAWLVGATPELLVSRRGPLVYSHPLAGSARRCADPDEDARAADALLASTKDHDEHRHVVEAIVAALAPVCEHVEAAARPSLHATASMWHLGTRIQARLKDPSTTVASLVARLHPTPAVCGTPQRLALDTIRSLEPVPRGFYAGAVGWTDVQGDGDWYVAIRCARVQGNQVRLYAGAGVVAGSDPAAELAETAAKFTALLTALGASDVPTT